MDKENLGNMSVSVPSPRKTKTETMPVADSSSKKKGSGTKKHTSGSNDDKQEQPQPQPQPGAKATKGLFEKAFRIMTMTMGSLSCCLQRATSMSRADAESVARRLNDAVHVMSQTRIIVFKAVENYVYLKVTENSSATASPMMFVDSIECASSAGPSNSVDPPNINKMDPLDLLLHKDHGVTIIRNLIGIVMRGQVERTMGGTTPKSELAIMACETAGDMYRKICLVLPNLGPSNPENLPLGVPLMEMAVNVHSAIRTHFRRLPELVVNKVIILRESGLKPLREELLVTHSIPDIR